jgi:hypothetical protein
VLLNPISTSSQLATVWAAVRAKQLRPFAVLVSTETAISSNDKLAHGPDRVAAETSVQIVRQLTSTDEFNKHS